MRASSVSDMGGPNGGIGVGGLLGMGRSNAPVPSCDARARMAVTLLASVITIVISSLEGQSVLFVASLLYALAVRRFKALAIAYLFIALMMILATLWSSSPDAEGMTNMVSTPLLASPLTIP